LRLRRKLTLGIATAAVVVSGTFAATNAFADDPGGEYTATITKDGACFRDEPYSSSKTQYCRDKGERDVLTCQVTNKYGNVWYKTNTKALPGRRLNVYSSYFSSAYKNFLPKC
jgi:hypothetical protein